MRIIYQVGTVLHMLVLYCSSCEVELDIIDGIPWLDIIHQDSDEGLRGHKKLVPHDEQEGVRCTLTLNSNIHNLKKSPNYFDHPEGRLHYILHLSLNRNLYSHSPSVGTEGLVADGVASEGSGIHLHGRGIEETGPTDVHQLDKNPIREGKALRAEICNFSVH